MRHLGWLMAGVLGAPGVPAQAGVMPIEAAAKLFGARPAASSVDVSPDGSAIVYIAAGPGPVSHARVVKIATGEAIPLISSRGQPDILDRCFFVSNRSVICRYGGNLHYGGVIIGASRTMAIDIETRKMKLLAVRATDDDQSINQFDGRVIDFLPDEQGAVLMQRNYVATGGASAGLGVDRIDVETFKIKRVEFPTVDATAFMTDGHGSVRFEIVAPTDPGGVLTGKTIYRYRTAGKRTWRELSGRGDDFVPLAVDRSIDSPYFLDKLDGRAALYRMKLDGSEAKTLVASRPDVDIDDVIAIAPGDPVVGYRFTDDQTRSVYFDKEYARLNSSLSKALPGSPLIAIFGGTKDKQKLLIFASGDREPGAYYLLDRSNLHLDSLILSRPEIDIDKLAPVKSLIIKTRDGKTIPAYLTMSVDHPGKSRPTVVLPHGGPSSRDTWGFDWLAQFLAARGYAVIQPNFRGSAGYGATFLGENAFKGWRLAMNDLADSADWLVKQGIADPDRMAIVGWSYGGYAALQSAALDPRYKAVVAIAPVTDFGALRRDAEGFSDVEIAKDMVGKGPHLREGSPLYNAAKIKVPVMLVHGDLDSNVRIAHSQRMNAVLKKAGTPVEFLSYKMMDHQLEDSDVRIEMLTRIGQLLDRTIGH